MNRVINKEHVGAKREQAFVGILPEDEVKIALLLLMCCGSFLVLSRGWLVVVEEEVGVTERLRSEKERLGGELGAGLSVGGDCWFCLCIYVLRYIASFLLRDGKLE